MPTVKSGSTQAWDLAFALPNLEAPDRSFETRNLLLPAVDDERLVALIARDPRVGKFLSAFADEHGRATTAAAVLAKSAKPDLEAVYAFRDAVALSTVMAAVARHIRYHSGGVIGLLFSDYFKIHATTLARGDEDLVVTQTQALRGLDDLEDFTGAIDPALPARGMRQSHIDQSIYLRLMRAWAKRFGSDGRRSARARAVFRALNMAFEAASMPHNHLAFDRDLGVRLAQWVAAFEILVWPLTKRADFEQVEAQLTAHAWQHDKCRMARYKIRRRNKTRKVTLPVYLYYLIYMARNTYLHGEPIRRRHMFPFSSGQSLLAFAPLLFRVLLDMALPPTARLTARERAHLNVNDERAWRLMQQGDNYDTESALVAATKPRSRRGQ